MAKRLLLLLAALAFAWPSHAQNLTGVLEVLQEDGPTPQLHHFLKTPDGKRKELHFEDHKPPKVPHGTPVRLMGHAPSAEPALALNAADVQPIVNAAGNVSTGPRAVLKILVNFQDNRTLRPVSNAAQVLTDTATYYAASSGGRASLTGTVVGYYTLPMNTPTTCDYANVQTYAEQAIAAAGIVGGNYQTHVYVMPQVPACGWWGLGTVGGPSGSIWINGTDALQVLGHELGHNLGLYHAHALNCGATPIGASCTSIEYGDYADIMGQAGTADFNPFHKEQLGWTSAPLLVSNGTVTLEPYEAPPAGGAKAIRVPKPDGSFYYVEYRQPVGIDAAITGIAGVLVRSGGPSDPNSSNLLNMNAPQDLSHAALAVGEQFVDANGQISVTVQSATAAGATVQVVSGAAPPPPPVQPPVTPPPATCVLAAPRATVTPQVVTVAAGSPQPFAVSVTNLNIGTCPAATMTVTASTAPAGWATPTTTLSVATGATATATWNLLVPSAASGTQVIILAVSQTPTLTSSTALILSVTAAPPPPATCVLAAPKVAVQVPSTPVSLGTTATAMVSITNLNTAACAPALFSVGIGAGSSPATVSMPTLTLASGVTGTVAVQIPVPATQILPLDTGLGVAQKGAAIATADVSTQTMVTFSVR